MGLIAVILLLVGMAFPIVVIGVTVIFDGGILLWAIFKYLRGKHS